MKKTIFLPFGSVKGDRVHIEGEDFHYLKNVVRVQRGNVLDAVIGYKKYHLVVSSIQMGKILCDIIRQRNILQRSNILLHVYLGLLKSKKMDFAVAKLSEMGVESLQPIVTERTVPEGNTGIEKMNRWEKIARDGAKVSGFERVIRIFRPCKLDEIIDKLKSRKDEYIFIFSTDVHCNHLKKVLDSINFHDGMVFHLFFGPEGGFTSGELTALNGINAIPVSMGNFVFRSETAAIVGTGFLRLYYYGE